VDKRTYRIIFNKTGWMRYISHLDLMRLFSRAARRAGFGLYLTQGFNPHPLIRIKRALKLGLEGKGEEAEFVLTENITTADFGQRLKEQLPEGIELLKTEKEEEENSKF